MPRRFPGALVVRLEENYRSTPEILAVANRLVPELGGSEKVLRAVLPAARSRWRSCSPTALTEAEFVVGQVRRLAGEGVPYEEMAVLYRLNARSEDYEEAFALAGIPFQVRGAAFIRRPAAQRTLRLLRGRGDASALGAVTEVVRRQGWVANPPGGLGEEELTRQADLGRLLALVGAAPGGLVGRRLPARPRGSASASRARAAASTCSRTTAPRASSGRRSSSRAWRRRSSRTARPAARSAWPRSAASSTSASRARSAG